jgi:hypothetical protein
MSPEIARAIAELRADAATQERIEDLAQRHHEGELNSDELEEYGSLVAAVNLLSVLQAKARNTLKIDPPS